MNVLDELRSRFGCRVPYEGTDGVTYHAIDAFKVWRSLPEQIRADVRDIVWRATVGGGDKHVRNGGRALVNFLDAVEFLCSSAMPERPIMPGDPDADRRRREREELREKLEFLRLKTIYEPGDAADQEYAALYAIVNEGDSP